MPSPSLCPEFETYLISNRKVIELVLQLKSAKAHSKNYIKVKPPLFRHLYRNRLLSCVIKFELHLSSTSIRWLTTVTEKQNIHSTNKNIHSNITIMFILRALDSFAARTLPLLARAKQGPI